MDERDKIERLAKAMGHDVWRNDQGFTVIDGLHSEWNPWENPADLRQVIEAFERLETAKEANLLADSFERIFDGPLEAACAAIRNPSYFADAALAVLEAEA
jgi:hypothetical protein